MPFTPFHWGPALLLGIYAEKYFDFPSLMVAAVAVDFRTTLVFFGLLDGPLHGVLHTFHGATLVAIIVTLILGLSREKLEKWLSLIGINQSYSWKKIFAGSLAGSYSHVVLDAMIYEYLQPFYFTSANPFYGYVTSTEMYLLCTLTGIIGVFVLLRRPGFKLDELLESLQA